MDTRTIIAFGMMILIYFWFFQPAPHDPNLATNAVVASQVQDTKVAETSQIIPVATSTANSELEKKSFWLKNDLMEVELNGLGSVKRVEFIKYKQELKSNNSVNLLFEPKPFNSIDLQTSKGSPQWKVSSQTESELVLNSKIEVSEVQRTISLAKGEYGLRIKDTVKNASAQSLKLESKIQLNRPPLENPQPASFWVRIFKPQAEVHEVILWNEGAIWRHLLGSLAEPIDKAGAISWTGFGDKYFFYGIVPQDISIQNAKIEDQKSDGYIQNLNLSSRVLPPSESTSYNYFLYAGPKDIPELRKASPELGEVVDYGTWIGPIARLLLSILHFFYKIIANYGVGIILLTILVKACLFPLAFKSAVSMRRLQLVHPKMKEIRDKYKNDKQRMNVEMMNLYKTEKVNPVGGCLPLLLQMPVFFALYRVFFASIEFRHAPFFGWIRDLSVHDPLFVTPVLITVLMW